MCGFSVGEKKSKRTTAITMSSYFCFEAAPDSKYTPLSTNDYNKPLLPQEIKRDSQKTEYPGYSRSIITDHTPPNSTLVKTGGNALQAVDRSELDQKNIVTGEFKLC